MKKHISVALLSLAALASAAQDEVADTRPFKLCTDFEQVRYGNEFIIAHPQIDTTTLVKSMYVLSQTYEIPASNIYERNIAYSFVCDDDTLMIPYLAEAEILTLRKNQQNDRYNFILNRIDTDGSELVLYVNDKAIVDNKVSLMTTKSGEGFEIVLNPKNHLVNCTAYVEAYKTNTPFNKLVFTKNRAIYSFLCDKLEGSNKSQPNYEPYFYFRPRLDLEYFSCDLPDADDIWSLTEYDETVFYTFDNPYYVDNVDDITWNVALTDAVLGEQLFEGTGTSMELSIALPGTYDITVNDGIADYHKTLTVNPDPERHFTTINYLNKPHFADGYKIPNYTEGYNYYYKYNSLISDIPEQTESLRAKAPALDGFTAYDHSTGIPEPSTSYGILTLAVERNGVSATHEILYSEVSGVADAEVEQGYSGFFFDFSGRPLPQAPAKGLYIRKAGSKVEKVSAAN